MKKTNLILIFVLFISFMSGCNHKIDDTKEEKVNKIAKQEEVKLPIKKEASLDNLLIWAIQPLGKTMYVWGGGWNEADDGAGIEALSYGISKNWEKFYQKVDENYDYHDYRYQIHDGLDCSGYIGWLMYQIMGDQDKIGYVLEASKMASDYAKRGWGKLEKRNYQYDAGNIISMKGHVWLSLGKCSDGSVLLIHSSPPGVRVCGILNHDGSSNQAVKLATNFMKKYYPNWYQRYPNCGVDVSYLNDNEELIWNDTLVDKLKLKEKSGEDIIKYLENWLDNN